MATAVRKFIIITRSLPQTNINTFSVLSINPLWPYWSISIDWYTVALKHSYIWCSFTDCHKQRIYVSRGTLAITSKLSEVATRYDAAVVRLEARGKLKNSLRSKNSNFHTALGMGFPRRATSYSSMQHTKILRLKRAFRCSLFEVDLMKENEMAAVWTLLDLFVHGCCFERHSRPHRAEVVR